MADLSITAANVRSYGTQVSGIAGESITQGQTVRLNTSTGKYVISSDDSAANAATAGIALNAASDNQPLYVHTAGLINPGATVAVGKVYVQSTSGAIAPVDDIASSEYITVIGVGTTTSRIKVAINQSGVAAAGAVS